MDFDTDSFTLNHWQNISITTHLWLLFSLQIIVVHVHVTEWWFWPKKTYPQEPLKPVWFLQALRIFCTQFLPVAVAIDFFWPFSEAKSLTFIEYKIFMTSVFHLLNTTNFQNILSIFSYPNLFFFVFAAWSNHVCSYPWFACPLQIIANVYHASSETRRQIVGERGSNNRCKR